MKLRLLLFLAWWILAFAGSATAVPLPDWLQPLLTADTTTLSKGSNAVQLLDAGEVRYTTAERVRRLQRGAVRALTHSGRAEAVCGYHYDADTEKILAARAWIISPDGQTMAAFSIRDFSDTVTKLGDIYWDRERVLGFNAAKQIQTGGVLAWEIEVESRALLWNSSWAVMPRLPTYLCTFDVTPAPGAKLEWHASEKSLGAPEPGAIPGSLHWAWRSVPAIKRDEAPPGFIPRLRLISVRAVQADGSGTPRTWPELARLFADVVEPRIEVTPEVKTTAVRLVAGKSARWDRIRALTEFVQREIVYVGVKIETDYLAGCRPHAAPEVLRNRYGDCKDKAALLVALLRAIGERGCVAFVAAGNPKAIDPEWPGDRFNHAIVAIEANDSAPADWPTVTAGELGTLVLFDATDAHTPLGFLSEDDQGGFGLVINEKSAGLVTLPVSHVDTNRHDLRVHAVLDARGNARVTTTEILRGSSGVAWHAHRERQSDERFTPELESRVHDTLAVFDRLQWKDAWDAAKTEWRLDFSFVTPAYGRPAGNDLLLVSPQLIWASPRLPRWKTKQAGVVWFPASYLHKEIRITLPPNATVEELPADRDEKVGKATCHLRYERDGRSIVFRCDLKEQAGFLDYESYEARRLLLERIEEAERRRIVIRVATGS
jgi:hypothetical protein